MKSELHNLIFDLDDCLTKLLVNIESLEQIQYELANVRQQFDLRSGDNNLGEVLNYPIIRILDDLLFYTLVDMNANYETASLLVRRMSERISPNLEN